MKKIRVAHARSCRSKERHIVGHWPCVGCWVAGSVAEVIASYPRRVTFFLLDELCSWCSPQVWILEDDCWALRRHLWMPCLHCLGRHFSWDERQSTDVPSSWS